MSKSLTWEPSWQAKDVEVQSTECLYEGYYTLKRNTLRHRLFSGGWTPWIVREQLIREDAVSVLLYDPKRDEVVLVEQFRAGPLSQPHSQGPWLLEIVAGLLDKGELPEQTAKREAMEEAGLVVSHLEHICCYYNTPGGFTERTHVYCGLVDATNAGGIYGNHHEHEDIKVHVLPCEAINQLLKAGRLTSASTVIALQWLALNRERLCEKP